MQEAMDKVAALTGRPHRLFDYVGHPEARALGGKGRRLRDATLACTAWAAFLSCHTFSSECPNAPRRPRSRAQADRVVVAMGSGTEVLEAAVGHLTRLGQKVGLIKVRGRH